MGSEDTLLFLSPLHGEFDDVNQALMFKRNTHPVLLFSVGDLMRFKGIMPSHYDGGGLTIDIWYTMFAAGSGVIAFETAIEREGDTENDIWSDSFEAAQSSGDKTPSSSYGKLTIATTTHTSGTQMDGTLVGEPFRLEVKRVAPGGSSWADDLELWGIEIKET